MAKIKLGTLVEIRFLDHCQGGCEPMEFRAVGWLKHETDRHYVIASWDYVTDVYIPSDDNVLTFNILKSTIRKIRRVG